MNTDSEDPRKLYKESENLVISKNYNDALEKLEKAINIINHSDERDEEFLTFLHIFSCEICIDANKNNKALLHAQKAVNIGKLSVSHSPWKTATAKKLTGKGLMSMSEAQNWMSRIRHSTNDNQKKKGGCFIATAVCGSDMAEEVIYLSRFRDEVLVYHFAGRRFIQLYYAVSPMIASRISKSTVMCSFVRLILIRPVSRIVSNWLGDGKKHKT